MSDLLMNGGQYWTAGFSTALYYHYCNFITLLSAITPPFMTRTLLKKSRYLSRLPARMSLIKLFQDIPFPNPHAARNYHRILLNRFVFLFAGRSFPGYFPSPARNSSKVFENSPLPSQKLSRIFPSRYQEFSQEFLALTK
jgi:hypothetical protein